MENVQRNHPSAVTHTEALYIRSVSSWDTDWTWCNPGFCQSNAIECQSDLFIQMQIWWAPFTINKLWEKSTWNLSFTIFSPFSTLICGSTTTWTFEILQHLLPTEAPDPLHTQEAKQSIKKGLFVAVNKTNC